MESSYGKVCDWWPVPETVISSSVDRFDISPDFSEAWSPTMGMINTCISNMEDKTQLRPSRDEALSLVHESDLVGLMDRASTLRDAGFRNVVTYSRKVFIPLTQLCRDVCHYCTFAQPPKTGERAYMTIAEVIDIAQQGANAGCREALFTLGDKPELR